MLAYPREDPARVASELSTGRIHLWVARLDPPAERVASLGRLLDPDERARAGRFRFDVHRRRFTVGRGFQRAVLGAYLGCDPSEIAYVYGPKGKPALAEGCAAATGGGAELLQFNLSNSAELAILGLVRGPEIGVDVEHLRPLSDLEQLASRFFSSGESGTLLGLPHTQRTDGFFNCWTRKEAYLKAVGSGLSAPLDAFDVTLVPGEPARMLALEGDPERAAAWTFLHLQPAEGYLGAVAVEAGEQELSAWSWE